MSCKLTGHRESSLTKRNPNPKNKGYYIFETGLLDDLPSSEYLWEYENYIIAFNPTHYSKVTVKQVTEIEFIEYNRN